MKEVEAGRDGKVRRRVEVWGRRGWSCRVRDVIIPRVPVCVCVFFFFEGSGGVWVNYVNLNAIM